MAGKQATPTIRPHRGFGQLLQDGDVRIIERRIALRADPVTVPEPLADQKRSQAVGPSGPYLRPKPQPQPAADAHRGQDGGDRMGNPADILSLMHVIEIVNPLGRPSRGDSRFQLRGERFGQRGRAIKAPKAKDRQSAAGARTTIAAHGAPPIASRPTQASARIAKAVTNTKRLCDIMLRPGSRSSVTNPGTSNSQVSPKNPRPSQKMLIERCRRLQNASGAASNVAQSPA